MSALDSPDVSDDVDGVDDDEPFFDEVVELRQEGADARRLANEIRAHADEHDVRVDTVVVPGHPAQEIVRAAKDRQADLIVLGHTGHAAMRGALLGGVPEHVTRHAPCSVLIVR